MKLRAVAILLCAAFPGCAGNSTLEPPKSRPIDIDPVCGRTVDPSTPFKGSYGKEVYSFHADACRERFAADPAYFAFGPYPDRGPRVREGRVYYTDPVCDRETPPTRWSTEQNGRVYYFHDEECFLEFKFRPQAYVLPEAPAEAR